MKALVGRTPITEEGIQGAASLLWPFACALYQEPMLLIALTPDRQTDTHTHTHRTTRLHMAASSK